MNGLWTVNKCVCTYDQPEISRATKIKDKKIFLANHTQKNIKMKPYRAPDLSFSDGSSKKNHPYFNFKLLPLRNAYF